VTPIICSQGEQCNPDNGACEPIPAVCPCWSQEDLDALPYPTPGDQGSCRKDYSGGGVTNNDEWRLSGLVVASIEQNGAATYPTCNLYKASGGSKFFQVSDPAAWAVCEQQVAQSGHDRGFSCFP